MSLAAWIAVGLLAGVTANKIGWRTHDGLLRDASLGVVGAVLAGSVFVAVALQRISGLNLWSVLVASAGAVLFLFVFHAVRRTV
jgi:uncharacterized membrane protein YeaQ/YmgE (transglycosylase-associated protein family)